ncbi:hypothetical protein ScPMuIL_005057 [Solemya velum]
MNRVSTVVSTKWLADKLSAGLKDIRILDGSWYLPSMKRNTAEEYRQKHIPEAVFFSIDECSDTSSNLDHMLPESSFFEKYVGGLGVNNQTHVVVYDSNETFGLFSAQRVWWTFRAFGHEKVSVLDGGLAKWCSEGRSVTSDATKVSSEIFKANFCSSSVKSFKDIENNIEVMKLFQLLDARPAGRFNGTAPEPRAEIKPGHIPGAINIPFMNIMDPEKKIVKTKEELVSLFEGAGVDLERPIVVSCGSGVTACCLALAAHICGLRDVPVYDGAWTEWFLKAKPDQKVNCPKD